MTILWNGIGLVFCGLTAIMILKETRKEFVPYILLTLCILVFLMILPLLRETSEWINSSVVNTKYSSCILKAAGISILTEVSSEICKACGENGIATYASCIGKAEILFLTLPLFRELTELAVGFMT